MAEKDKRYYWLKLKRDFFKRHDIQIIESMPNGKDYILFYLKLLCESVDHEGNLRFSEQIPYNEQMLATITNTNVDIVRSAINIFSELHMMEIMDDGTYYMNEVSKMLGSETYWAKKKREQRSLEGDSIGHFPMVSNNFPTCPSKSIEKEIDKDIDIDNIISASTEPESKPKKTKPVKHKYGEYNNVLLTDEELGKLKEEYADWQDRIERLSSYVASTGKSYKSHYATIRNWARKDTESKQQPVKTKNMNNFNRRQYDMDAFERTMLAQNFVPETDPEFLAEAEALKRTLQEKY